MSVIVDNTEYSVGDKVYFDFLDKKYEGAIWKISDYGVHVKTTGEEDFMFIVFHFNPTHHKQTPVSKLSKLKP